MLLNLRLCTKVASKQQHVYKHTPIFRTKKKRLIEIVLQDLKRHLSKWFLLGQTKNTYSIANLTVVSRKQTQRHLSTSDCITFVIEDTYSTHAGECR